MRAAPAIAVVLFAVSLYYLLPPNTISFIRFFFDITIFRDETWTTSDGREERVLAYVKQHATRGDPVSVLNAIDKKGWESDFMMNVGDVKGKILRNAVENCVNCKHFVEIGSYIGYSAVLISSLLKFEARLTCVDISDKNINVAKQMVAFAGTAPRVDFVSGVVPHLLPELKKRLPTIDFVFLDHDKDEYIPDLKALEASGLMHKGTVVVADNTGLARDVVTYLQESGKYEGVEVHESHVEYVKFVSDSITVAVYRG